MRLFVIAWTLLTLIAGAVPVLVGLGTGRFVPRETFAARVEALAPHAVIVLPEGPPRGVVLLFHGCGGVNIAMTDWSVVYASLGLASITVDSLAPRGIGRAEALTRVCGGSLLWGQERAGDVFAAIALAGRDPALSGLPVVLAGWSHGGWSILEAMGVPDGTLPWGLADRPEDLLERVVAVQLTYPYCGPAASGRISDWTHLPPTLLLQGARDTVVGVAACQRRLAPLEERGLRLEQHLFEGTDHSFDQRDLPDFTYLAHDPEATAKAHALAVTFLRSVFGE
ncbi:MAG: dienelactone hydrolase family protein [Alphaproteobacteria bacterium]|nr:dienelactone hydrolase family protein [Alphaproteobacteria bacterium]